MRERPKPHEVDYEYYREQIELMAEGIMDEIDIDDDPALHERVWESADSCRFVTHYGYQLAAIMQSDQNPDVPDYCESWNVYYDSPDDDETASYTDATMAMAYVCVYSDVYDKVQSLWDEQRAEPKENHD